MKKYIALFLTAILLISVLCSCKKSADVSTGNSSRSRSTYSNSSKHSVVRSEVDSSAITEASSSDEKTNTPTDITENPSDNTVTEIPNDISEKSETGNNDEVINKSKYIFTFIGNSILMNNNTAGRFKNIAEHQNNNIEIKINHFLEGGASLKDFASQLEKNDTIKKTLKESDYIILQDYGRVADNNEAVKAIINTAGSSAKIYFFLSHFNTGFTDVGRQYSKYGEYFNYLSDLGNTIEAFYNGHPLTDKEKRELKDYHDITPYESYAEYNINYIPAGLVFETLLYKNNMSYDSLISSDFTHPYPLLSYFDALTMYYVFFGGIGIEESKINALWKDKPENAETILTEAITGACDDFKNGKTLIQQIF